jgi:preprotein translocase subunit Sec61beta
MIFFNHHDLEGIKSDPLEIVIAGIVTSFVYASVS